MKIVFFNEFNLFKNNSAGITVRDLFEEDVCRRSLQIVYQFGTITCEKEGVCLSKDKISYKSLYKVIRMLKNERADVIYTTGNSIRALFVLCILHLFTHLPVLVHYFDNWREYRHPAVTNFLLRIINGKKEISLVISDEMGHHYKDVFHGEYVTLMVGSGDSVKRNTLHNSGVYRFLYAGGFHLGRVNALLQFEKALTELRDNNIKLLIVTFKKDYEQFGHLFNPDITEFKVDVPHSELNQYYNVSQALLFVEPAPKESILFLKYSMSTKIPEYLCSGLPILCYAHPDIAPTHYFQKTESAIVVTQEKELVQSIKSIFNRDIIKNTVESAQLAARRDFSKERQHIILRNTLERVAGTV